MHFAELCLRCLSIDPNQRPSAGEAAALLSARRPTVRASLPRSHALRRTRTPPPPRHQRLLQLIVGAFVISATATAVALVPFAGSGSRTTVVAPIPLPTPVPTLVPPPETASPSPSLVLSEGPTTPPPANPAEQFGAIVQAGLTRGEIRPDVAADLRTLLGGLEESVANVRQVEVTSQAANLRQRIDTQARDGGISQPIAQQLRAALARFTPSATPTGPPGSSAAPRPARIPPATATPPARRTAPPTRGTASPAARR